MFLQLGIWGVIIRSTNIFLSGFSPGNYLSGEIDRDNERWLSQIINSRTQKNDVLLYCGIPNFSIERKVLLHYEMDKEPIIDIAEKSSDINNLKENLEYLGINHIIIVPADLFADENHPMQQLRLMQREAMMIKDLFRQIKLQLVTPDGRCYWYSLQKGENNYPIILNQSDIEKFPIVSLYYADALLAKGQTDLAASIYELAGQSHIAPENKSYALIGLADLVKQRGRIEQAKSLYQRAIGMSDESKIAMLKYGIFLGISGTDQLPNNLLQSLKYQDSIWQIKFKQIGTDN